MAAAAADRAVAITAAMRLLPAKQVGPLTPMRAGAAGELEPMVHRRPRGLMELPVVLAAAAQAVEEAAPLSPRQQQEVPEGQGEPMAGAGVVAVQDRTQGWAVPAAWVASERSTFCHGEP